MDCSFDRDQLALWVMHGSDRIESTNREQRTINREDTRKKYMMRKKGFTLVELMIVMAIVGIMTAVTIVSLGDARDRKAAEGEARKFAAVVREVQNYALTGKQLSAGEVTCSVGMRTIALATGATTSYDIFYTYRSGADCNTSTAVIFATNTLLNEVEFSNATTAFSFSVPRAELNFSGPPKSFVLSKGSATYAVCVYPSGRIEDVSGSTCP